MALRGRKKVVARQLLHGKQVNAVERFWATPCQTMAPMLGAQILPLLLSATTTVQEQFIDNNQDGIHDKELLDLGLAEYLIF